MTPGAHRVHRGRKAVVRIPLAWLQLARQRLRLFVAIAGVTFAVVLVFMQLGFRRALFKSATRVHESLDGDLFLINPHFAYLVAPDPFPRRRVQQARGFAGVVDASSVYIGLSLWKNPFSGGTRQIFVLGFDPDDHVVRLAGVERQLDLIRYPDSLLFDARSRAEYGPVADYVGNGATLSAEVGGRVVHVVGLFELGTSFGVDGTLITSDLNFLRLFPLRRPTVVDIGVVRLDPHADPAAVRAAMKAHLPNDVLILTRQQFIDREVRYWATGTPIGYVFTFGVIMGLFVGAIIVYQILFADVADHLTEYATLKALGYSSRSLFSIVLEEALILALLGYLPGLGLCLALYRLTADATRLPMEMTRAIALFVFALTVAMCCLSGALALRKVRSADPAEIF